MSECPEQAVPEPIGAITPSCLSEANAEGRMDPASSRLRRAEWPYIAARRREAAIPADAESPANADQGNLPERDPPEDLTGLAFSGGGIRSATFSLGVIQALADRDCLKWFDYLSTVSGGGYIGSSLTWFTSEVARKRAEERSGAGGTRPGHPASPVFGVGPSGSSKPLPYGTVDPREEKAVHPTPPEGAILRYLRQHGNYLIPGEGITLTSGIVVLLRGLVLNLLVWLPIVAGVMLALIVLSERLPRFHAVTAFFRLPEDMPTIFLCMLLAAILLFLSLTLNFVIYSVKTYSPRRQRSARRYEFRRATERDLRFTLWAIGLLILFGTVPLVAAAIGGWITGASFTLVGLITGIVSFVRSTRPEPGKKDGATASGNGISGWIAPVGAGLIIYGIPLLSYAIAHSAFQQREHSAYGIIAIVLLAIGALVTGYFVNLNYITVHRFYRDRLMEAFLPDIDRAIANQTGAAEHADPVRLWEMCAPAYPIGPYHIINTNLVVTHSDERTLRLRGGDNFSLTPLYCGSNATGWRPTCKYMGGGMTLASAMAISGAAANPWAGSGGTGVIRNPFVSTLMALTNLRLGYWARNPGKNGWDEDNRPNHFAPGLSEVLGRNLHENSRVCLLSDGGHFENLALYELIRRRARLIVLCDGAADPNYEFTDLHLAMSRIRNDFGARIHFKIGAPAQFVPAIEVGYPRGVRLSKKAFAIARITYSDGSKGRLVYLTTALTEGLRLELLGYKGANSDFPDQSTGDQFFDETQFEAYRELGYAVADAFFKGRNRRWLAALDGRCAAVSAGPPQGASGKLASAS